MCQEPHDHRFSPDWYCASSPDEVIAALPQQPYLVACADGTLPGAFENDLMLHATSCIVHFAACLLLISALGIGGAA